MRQAFLFTTALTLVIAVGIVHGRWTRRWAGSHEVEAAVAALGRVPLDLGDWRGRPMELGRDQLSVGEIDGYLLRHYGDPRGGDVTMLLVCGRPGPISVHTPDICYAGAGYEPTGARSRRTLSTGALGRAADFRHAVFARAGVAVPAYLRILWSWSSGGAWEAPDNPRFAFASRRALYKLYVIREIMTLDENPGDDPSLRFLQALIPELERTLSGVEGGEK